MRRRRPPEPRPYWVAECPILEDQGQVEAWITAHGRPALVCDVCHTLWFDTDLATDRAVFPEPATGRLPDGDSIYVGGSRPATRDELEELGWWSQVTPLSRGKG